MLHTNADKLFLWLWKEYQYAPAERVFKYRSTGDIAVSSTGMIKVFNKPMPVDIVFKIYFKLIADDSQELKDIVNQLLNRKLRKSPQIQDIENRPPDYTPKVLNPMPGIRWNPLNKVYQVWTRSETGGINWIGQTPNLDEAIYLRQQSCLRTHTNETTNSIHD